MDLGRQYEKFKGGPTQATSLRVHLTLSPNGTMFLNRNVYRMWGKPLAAYLFYSREDDKIALVPTQPVSSESFPIREKKHGWMIHAAPFCRHFRIRPDGVVKFIDPEIMNDGKMFLDLSKTISVSRGPRRKKGK